MQQYWNVKLPTGTNRYFNKIVSNFGIEVDMVDPIDLAKFESKVKTNTAVRSEFTIVALGLGLRINL